MVKEMDFGIVVTEFEIQSSYYFNFRANTFGERWEPFYSPSYGLKGTTTFLLGEWLWH